MKLGVGTSRLGNTVIEFGGCAQPCPVHRTCDFILRSRDSPRAVEAAESVTAVVTAGGIVEGSRSSRSIPAVDTAERYGEGEKLMMNETNGG
jgi:hypothetical protein